MEPISRPQRFAPTRRSVLAGAAGLAGGLALAACGSSGGKAATSAGSTPTLEPKADGDLTWFSWDGYVDPTIVSDFEKKYSVKVTIATFDSNDTMIQKLAAGLPYDLITNNSGYMFRSIQGKLLQPYSLAALTNYSQIVPYFQKPSYDNGAERYSVPYSGGPTGILWRTDKVPTMTQSWNDLWNNPEAKGHIYVLDYVEDTMGASLLRKGYNVNSGDNGQVASATDQLIQLKAQLAGISSDTRTNVGNGDAWIHHAWVPDAVNVMTKSKYADRLQFELTTKDGVPYGMDVLTIGAKAKSPGTAMLFIDWMLSPENLEKTAAYTGQQSGTTAGDAAFAKVVKDFPALAGGATDYTKALWRESATGARQQLWTQQWNRFKAT
jgi:spermidine/putrescine transport system substrate-binding protein